MTIAGNRRSVLFPGLEEFYQMTFRKKLYTFHATKHLSQEKILDLLFAKEVDEIFNVQVKTLSELTV